MLIPYFEVIEAHLPLLLASVNTSLHAMSSNAQSEIPLPTEILSSICSYLPRSDLRALRLTSRPFLLAAERKLFQTINLRLTLISFERLLDIAEHRRLSTYVRYIYYDVRILTQHLRSIG
jgi:hypothetical protein